MSYSESLEIAVFHYCLDIDGRQLDWRALRQKVLVDVKAVLEFVGILFQTRASDRCSNNIKASRLNLGIK
jgi:hypothetical protein